MRFEEIKARVRAVEEVSAWPQMTDLLDRIVHRDLLSVWDYPCVVCEAVGGDPGAALPGSAAVLCSLVSIHLVDDMLDHDPRGVYHLWGAGPVANLALAFQAAGHRLLDDPAIRPELRAELQGCLAGMALGTAYGQGLDTRHVSSEEDYWRAVDAKTPPLFGAAFYLGALLGGAPAPVARQLERVGGILGRFVQVSDDLSDALQTPAGADWQSRTNNLPILYAMTAAHPAREEFLQLCTRAADPAALEAAHKILLRSGAVSYCAFKMIEFAREARALLATLPLHNPLAITRVLDLHLRPLHRLLESAGVEEPEALIVA